MLEKIKNKLLLLCNKCERCKKIINCFFDGIDGFKNLETMDLRSLFSLAVIIFIAWLGYWGLVELFTESNDTAGQYGDQFGAINALFSGLAFSGVIFTILLQRTELKLQRTELKLQRKELETTREELAGQKEQMEKQNRLAEIQVFESKLFGLLKFYNDAVSTLVYYAGSENNIVITGRTCFYKLYKDFFDNWDVEWERTKKEVTLRYRGFPPILVIEHCISILFDMMKFVHNNQFLANMKKYEYIDLIRSQLSNCEMFFIFYGVVCSDKDEIKEIIERYGFFSRLPNIWCAENKKEILMLLDPSHQKFYNEGAYKRQKAVK
ncbi:putative phage abortive infection protein [Spartinivicinus poritis]|uniref:Phage abortive infection protein n=1 Tax=Spartinivicinus poritis TaxID=2994640 RepID=A0ABT5U5P0_9GAMM|nr:putative phage abortive infection protein [Spartinivicinus sp. A2-2]MDE1461627.1 hypothetical protein [Spartinivicinus sp. A2-2]